MVWPTPFDKNAIASIGTPVEIVRGLTTFEYEFTTSNSYRFVWSNAAVNRDTNNLVTAALELFRNGDVSITTNGVAAHLPRELPFPHDGFGQDDAWVSANFTNATEILAVGYPQWVDAQVGTGLTNGLYKLTINFADDPPETTQISVGNLSIAVTNAGEYVFLMEKGEEYRMDFFPPSTNIAVFAVDDIPTGRGAPVLRSAYSWGDGVWSVEVGEFACDYAPGVPSARSHDAGGFLRSSGHPTSHISVLPTTMRRSSRQSSTACIRRTPHSNGVWAKDLSPKPRANRPRS